jgi:formylglycine-generating enzyme required for sulfatase activity
MEYMWAAMGATSDALSGDIVGGVNTGGYLKGYAGSTEAGSAYVNINSYAYIDNGSVDPSSTEAVGLLLPNELGLYDMSGNVWQWCWDRYGNYPETAITDPTGYNGAASGTARVVRGGGWGIFASIAAVAIRNNYYPCNQIINIGFRVVRP